jgi:beta-lactamase superfamily II metal-dependent hydrolase
MDAEDRGAMQRSETMFTIEMLPASCGDALWIEYGEPGETHSLLIDGGIGGTAEELERRLEGLREAGRELELVVVTHVDSDHIRGILKVFEDSGDSVPFKEMWFNNYPRLLGGAMPARFQAFSPEEGDALTVQLMKPELEDQWNTSFGGDDAVLIPEEGSLPVIDLEGGMKLTLLSPGQEQLTKLRPVWAKACGYAGIGFGLRFAEELELPEELEAYGEEAPPDIATLAETTGATDDREANGSSIVLLAEYDGRRALLAADAHPDVLSEGIKRVPGFDGKLSIDVFKLPHHGSDANVTNDLLGLVECDRYLVSTKGHAGHHLPGRAAMSRVIVHGRSPEKPAPHLVFNYHTDLTKVWGDQELQEQHDYTAEYPKEATGGILVEV